LKIPSYRQTCGSLFYTPTPRRGRGVYCFTSVLNLTGLKTLPTIWYTYMTLVTKYQISAINSYWEKCDEKYLGRTEGRMDGRTEVKQYTPLPLFLVFFLPVIASYIDSHPLIEGWRSLKTKRNNLNEDFSWILTNLGWNIGGIMTIKIRISVELQPCKSVFWPRLKDHVTSQFFFNCLWKFLATDRHVDPFLIILESK
jgi:hypothetical protein